MTSRRELIYKPTERASQVNNFETQDDIREKRNAFKPWKGGPVAMAEKNKQITFKYVHPADLRDLYVNGLWGGVTPRGEIYTHFYSERHPIPKKAVHTIREDGTFNPTGEIESGGDAVRLIQASICMDMQTAIAFRDWLTNQIDIANKRIEDGKV